MQVGEHLYDFLGLVCEVSVLVGLKVAEVVGEEQMVLNCCGAHGDGGSGSVGVAALAAAFGDVGGYGCRAAGAGPKPVESRAETER